MKKTQFCSSNMPKDDSAITCFRAEMTNILAIISDCLRIKTN